MKNNYEKEREIANILITENIELFITACKYADRLDAQYGRQREARKYRDNMEMEQTILGKIFVSKKFLSEVMPKDDQDYDRLTGYYGLKAKHEGIDQDAPAATRIAPESKTLTRDSSRVIRAIYDSRLNETEE